MFLDFVLYKYSYAVIPIFNIYFLNSWSQDFLCNHSQMADWKNSTTECGL